MSSQEDYLIELNPAQREAVLCTDGPVLIVAGAGSGKTRVLIYRMIHLVLGKNLNPANILGVTFTNRAAEEMKTRIRKSLGALADRIWIATFHSTCAQILRQEIHQLGYSRNFVIYDEEDSLSLIKRVIKEKAIDEKAIPPKWARSRIEIIKRDLIEINDELIEQEGNRFKLLAEVYKAYQQRLRLSNALDFEDLLLLTLHLFEQKPELLERYQDRFQYIMVDEYQDTNYVQYLLVRQLARKYQNLCVVGDEDQSIYRWRGANIENILNFTEDFPNAKVIKLEQNYRSTKRVIDSASKLISHNTKRIPKTLWTENPLGEKIQIMVCSDEREEAERVVENLLRLCADAYKYKDIAVFYRTHSQSRVVEDALRARELPYQIFGGLRFYERKEIKDILAYLKLLINQDDSVSLLRVINNPPRGIGPATIEHLTKIAQNYDKSLFQAIPIALNYPDTPDRAKHSLKEFLTIIQELKAQWQKGISLKELLELVMEKTGYEEELIQEQTIDAEARLSNLEELVNAVSEYEAKEQKPTLEGFLEKSALFQDIDRFSEKGLITLMTLHSAKGLEFPSVFIIGLDEGMLPHLRALEEGDEDELEEERRLFYVGITRAKQRLFLLRADSRAVRGARIYSEPSRFLEELPEEHIKFSGARKKTKIKTGFKPEWEAEEQEIEMEAENEGVWDNELELSWKKGLKVKHPTFGQGVIERVEGNEEKIKLVVKFKNAGRKKLLAKYAKLEILEYDK